jgi:hypothetical protein
MRVSPADALEALAVEGEAAPDSVQIAARCEYTPGSGASPRVAAVVDAR